MKEKVSSGDELDIAARTWNELIDAKNDFLRRKGVFARPASPARQQTKIKNETGDDLETGDAVALGDYALDDSVRKQNIIWLKGILPDGTHPGFAILANAIPNGQIGRCFTSGTCMARVNISDLNHQFAKVVAGQTILESASSGPVRLDSVPGEGPGQECIVTISPNSQDKLVVFELSETLNLGDTAGAKAIVCSLIGDQYVADGDQITVIDPSLGFGRWCGQAGYQGLARSREDGKFDVISLERKALIVSFTATQNRDPAGDSFIAQLTGDFQQGGREPDEDGNEAITIYDADKLFPRVLNGGKGLAIYNDRDDRYECLTVQQQCLLARALCDVSPGTGGFSGPGLVPIRSFVAISPSPFNLAPTPLPTEAINFFHHRGKTDDDLLLAWDDYSVDWIIVDVLRHDIDLVRDLKISDDGTSFQVKLQTVAAEIMGDSTTWTNKIDLKTC